MRFFDHANAPLTKHNQPTVTYGDVHGNTGAAEVAGADDPTGTEGNLAVAASFVDVSGTDPLSWDLTLAAGSPLIDAGDPTVLDADGTTSDMGAYGGPDGDGW